MPAAAQPQHPALVIFGYSEAAMFLAAANAPKPIGIISIHGTRQFGVEAECAHRIDLTFDDVEVPRANDSEAMQRTRARERWSKQNGLVEVAPTIADARTIIEFAQRVRDLHGTILIHCGAGISRAPAAALICLATWTGEGRERECVQHVRQVRRAALPHVGLVRFADELLGRNGKLVDALRD